MITLSRKNTKDLATRTNGSTYVPQIFVNDKYFGDLITLKNYFNITTIKGQTP